MTYVGIVHTGWGWAAHCSRCGHGVMSYTDQRYASLEAMGHAAAHHRPHPHPAPNRR